MRKALAVLALVLLPALAQAASPPPLPLPSPCAVPKTKLHAVVRVNINAKGQVTKALLTKPTSNECINLNVFGNAQQMFIRRPDGTALAGIYNVNYDYDPDDKKYRRTVEFVEAGGDPNAPGLVEAAKASPPPGAGK